MSQSTAPALLHPEQLLLRQLEVYYLVLSEEPDFGTSLDQLYELRDVPPKVIMRDLTRFCEQWHLPPRTDLQDVLWTLALKEDLLADGIAVRNLVPCPRLVTDYPSVLELARTLSGSTLAQAKTDIRSFLHQRGFRRVPPQHHDEQAMRWLARRLVRRVIQQLTWEQIAAAELLERGAADRESVVASVRGWSRTLGVPLPDKPRGRPKK